MLEPVVGVAPLVVKWMTESGVASEIVTVCADGKVPPAGEIAGAAVGGVMVKLAEAIGLFA